MRGKTYKAVKEKTPVNAVSIEEAVVFIKEHARKSFDETVELHIHLGVDPKKSDQMVRGSVVLPHGTPKKVKIAVFTSDSAKQTAAKEAGATIVGGEELVAKVMKDGGLDADIVVATPDMMPKIAKAAKILGPKGLMPNPKTGTVTPDVEKIVAELGAGKISFKMDGTGNLHESVAKASWETDAIVMNIEAFIQAVKAIRPPSQKGEFLRSVTLSSTMSPGVSVSH